MPIFFVLLHSFFVLKVLVDALSSMNPAPVRIFPADDPSVAALFKLRDGWQNISASLRRVIEESIPLSPLLPSKWEWSLMAKTVAKDSKRIRVPDAVLLGNGETLKQDFERLGGEVMVKLVRRKNDV